MRWIIERVYNFEGTGWKDGYCQFGFHGQEGVQYALDHEHHWLGELNKDDTFAWTAGLTNPEICDNHISINIEYPMYATPFPDDGSILVSSIKNGIYKIFPETKKGLLFINAMKKGLKDVGNCVVDLDNNIWVNEVTGCKLWQFNKAGNEKLIIGNGKPNFQKEPLSFSKAQFNWIYDIRMGSDEILYVLDSKNFALRSVDIEHEKVFLVSGCGKAGPVTEESDPLLITFGSDLQAKFDGPYSLSIDEENNLFVGDTYNHVVRMIERKRNKINTIAGNSHCMPGLRNDPAIIDPLKLNLPKICSMDYYRGQLFIPEYDGDLIIMHKTENSSGQS